MNELSDQEINRAVAEALGYMFKKIHFDQSYWAPCVALVSPSGEELSPVAFWDTDKRKKESNKWAAVYEELSKLYPDYCRDLNVCAEMEATLSTNEKDLYADLLVSVIEPSRINGYGDPENGSPQLSWPGVFQVATAAPRHRCLAFLRVVAARQPKA